MTRNLWKRKMENLRVVPYTTYTLLRKTFSFESIESIGESFVYDFKNTNGDKPKIGFDILLKSGKILEFRFDFEIQYDKVTKKHWLFRDERIVEVPKESQWYFDESEDIKDLEKLKKRIHKSWRRWLRGSSL